MLGSYVCPHDSESKRDSLKWNNSIKENISSTVVSKEGHADCLLVDEKKSSLLILSWKGLLWTVFPIAYFFGKIHLIYCMTLV